MRALLGVCYEYMHRSIYKVVEILHEKIVVAFVDIC